MAEFPVIPVGKWTIGFHHPTRSTVLTFEWTDRDAVNYAIPPDQAEELAKQILVNYQSAPPTRDRLS